MVSYEADLPVSQWVQKHYPQLAAMLAATFGISEAMLLKLLLTATHTARLATIKTGLDRVVADKGLAIDVRCSCGDSPSQEATCLLFSVFKPEMQSKVKPALTIGVDESGVYIDLQGLLVHAENDTRCRIDPEAIAAQLARTPKAQPYILAALKALPIKPQTRAQAYKAAALEALSAAVKVAPRLVAEGRNLLQVRYSAIIEILQAVFDGVPDLPRMVIPTVDSVLQNGSEQEIHVLGTDQKFQLRATDAKLPAGQISLEITCPQGQMVGLVITPRGCGLDFGYLRLSTEHGNRWNVDAFTRQMAQAPAFAKSLPRVLEAFTRLVRETPEMRSLRLDVLRQLNAPAQLLVVSMAAS